MNLSILEVAVVLALLLVSAVLRWQRQPQARWGFAAAFCFFLAGLLTPADPYSTVIVGLGMSFCVGVGAILKPSRADS